MEKCEICGKVFNNLKSLTNHSNSKHNMSSKEYFDSYILKEGGDKCVVCGEKTNFRNVRIGYLNNCSNECKNKNIDIRRRRSEVKIGIKQSKEVIEKRVKNTDQKLKEKNRKKTMLELYGVDNPSKIEKIKQVISKKLKGGKLPRTKEWQDNIIYSKKKNGTTTHNKETKNKISNKLKKYFINDFDRSKYISNQTNKKHLSGWYKGLFFRSSLELSFLISNSEKKLFTCETKEFGVEYFYENKRKFYYPDFTDGELIYEIKPYNLLNYNDNKNKILAAKEKYCEKYKVITEKECPYSSKEIILEQINFGVVILTEHSKYLLEKKYKY